MTLPARQPSLPLPPVHAVPLACAMRRGAGVSPAWPRPSANALLEPPKLHPSAASAWAEAIVGYWRSAHAHGLIDPAQTVDVMDLMPGRGEAAWLLLQALRQSLQAVPGLQLRFRYLACAPRRELLAALRGQQELQQSIHDETLVPVLWDPERGDPCLLTLHKRSVWEPVNPVVVLTHDLWARLEQRLLAVHYGKLLEADIAVLAGNQRPEEEARLWHPAHEDDLPEGVAQLARDCLSRFNSVPLPLPLGAIKLTALIAASARSGYLLLAAAQGLATEQQVRLQTFPALVERHRNGGALPVNFDLLARHFRSIGATAWQCSLLSGSAMQVVVGAMPDGERILQAATAPLSNGACGDAAALVSLARAAAGRARLEPEALLALLRQSGYDREVYAACSGVIIDALRPDAAIERGPWREALKAVWMRHLPLPGISPLHRILAPALMRAGAWGFARIVLHRGLQVYGDDALDLAHLAWCEFRTGRLGDAQRWIRRALALPQRHTTITEVAQRIDDKLQRLQGGWLEIVLSASLPICLEPLDIGHAEALHHQYRDPQIAVMTGLPALANPDATREWVNEHIADAARRGYAVMHAEHGFIGYACMSVSGTVAYFCFWIGADHQGSGYAVEVARLTCEKARCLGMTHIYTSAYDDNARSLRSLERSGFSRLPIRALSPDNDRTFLFMQGAGAAVEDPCADLVAYYRDEQLPLKFPESGAAAGQAALAAASAAGTVLASGDTDEPARSASCPSE